MAEHKQDLIIFDNDTFKIRYTFLSIQNELGNLGENEVVFDANFGAFWSAGLNSDWPTIPSMIRSKASAGWTYAIAFSPNDNNIDVISGTTIVDVNFNQSDFVGGGKLQVNTEYYTELVISNKADEANSIVAATGLLYTSASIFTAASYRP
tara:strand:- start:2764 stop:3216 length:453 start_codon:yes stop_codon:yes gene_type:complete